MKILITGGAGYIGSTVASACLDNGLTPVILDDFSLGRKEFVADRIAYEGDIADPAVVDRVFADHPDIEAVVHCAARIVVPESVAEPILYYRNNVCGTLALVESLLRNGCHRVVFSSSASIYSPDPDLTVDESSGLAPGSPYARTKMVDELMFEDCARATALRVLSLRYFNPVGTDPQLRTGLQSPKPTHAVGKLLEAYENGVPFTVTGVEWETRDGSAIRDYIHVWDLAAAHVQALLRFDDIATDDAPYQVINLGTGDGVTVRELVAAFEDVVGHRLDVVDGDPRPGDVIGCYTRSERARELLGWQTEKSLQEAITDALAWSKKRREVLGT
ncbi:MAG TPA: UDP-glucose 4-epimerase GalE [Mycobacteriales bacterium]|jgi:UDP-glucose 4-epimerase|nr:UDP-glucose 4-epimerase GalE [Mycobacteriales bacterium]